MRENLDSLNWMDGFCKTNRNLFVTQHFNEYLALTKTFQNYQTIKKVNKRFFRKLEKLIGFNQKTRLNRVVITETLSPRNHSHMVIEIPSHISYGEMCFNIQTASSKTRNMGSCFIKPVDNYSRLLEYLSKESSLNPDYIELENCFVKQF